MHSLLPWIFIAAFGLVFIALMIMLVRALERKNGTADLNEKLSSHY